MKGFHVSASGAIQGHHGPLVVLVRVYILNQFPSIVMLGMKGFHVSASGAIQGHHGPLVVEKYLRNGLFGKTCMKIFNFQ